MALEQLARLLQERNTRMHDLERQIRKAVHRRREVVNVECFTGRRRQPQHLVNCDTPYSERLRRLQQGGREVFTVQAPSLAFPTIEEGRIELQSVDPQLLDLPFQLTNGC
jgi:hypothetical protein